MINSVLVERQSIDLVLAGASSGGSAGAGLGGRWKRHSKNASGGVKVGSWTSVLGIGGVSGMMVFPMMSNRIKTFSTGRPADIGGSAHADKLRGVLPQVDRCAYRELGEVNDEVVTRGHGYPQVASGLPRRDAGNWRQRR